MRFLAILCALALTTCGHMTNERQKVNWTCDRDNHTPRKLPRVMTKDRLTIGYNELELSREAIIQERDECADKLSKAVQMLNGVEQ